jgi:hypothetical protein
MPELPTPPLWPFAAAQEITEVLEWRTDVLTSGAGEQRIALRPRPREIVTFQHRLDALGMARAAELARAGFAGDWHVPFWHMALQPSGGPGARRDRDPARNGTGGFPGLGAGGDCGRRP